MAKRRSGATRNQPRKQRSRPAWLNGRNLGGALFVALATWGAAAAGQWLADPANLPIQRVRIEGEFQHLAAAELERAMAPFVNEGFFGVDVEAVKGAAEALPWVAGASVRRLWPDTLRVRVEEHVPLARWAEDEVVSDRGVRFKVEQPIKGLPRFSGQPGLEGAMAENFQVMGRALAPLGVKIAALTVDGRRAWSVGLSNGVELMLGRSEVEHRLRRFVQFYPGALAARSAEVRRVDMRYPNGFAVQWRPQADGEGRPTQRG